MQRRLITFTRILHTGTVNFIRNASLAIAAMAVMLVTLIIVLFSQITNATFKNTIDQITNKINVSVFLQPNVTDTQAQQFAHDIQKQSGVKKVVYLNKQQALQSFINENRDNTTTATAVATVGNPIPATIQVFPEDLNQIPTIKNFLVQPRYKKLQTERSPSYNGNRKEAIDNITHATNVLRQIGVIMVIVFIIICALIIFNTIQMAIFNRRDEITIMRLLGANTSYIRGPFIVESAIYGFLAGAISTLIVYFAFQTAETALKSSNLGLGLLDIDYANRYLGDHFLGLLATQILLGIIIGTVSSAIATRRYLKFKTK